MYYVKIMLKFNIKVLFIMSIDNHSHIKIYYVLC